MVEVVVRVVEEVVEAAEVCRWRQRQRQHAHRHAMLPHQTQHALQHDAEGHVRAVAAARLAEEAHHVRLELERRRALLRRREFQHAPRRRRAVAGADRLDEADEGLTLVAREARDHPQIDEREDGRPSRRRVHQNVPRVEVGMHQIVDQQHLEVDVLAARHHEVREILPQSVATLHPERFLERVLRDELARLEALDQHLHTHGERRRRIARRRIARRRIARRRRAPSASPISPPGSGRLGTPSRQSSTRSGGCARPRCPAASAPPSSC